MSALYIQSVIRISAAGQSGIYNLHIALRTLKIFLLSSCFRGIFIRGYLKDTACLSSKFYLWMFFFCLVACGLPAALYCMDNYTTDKTCRSVVNKGRKNTHTPATHTMWIELCNMVWCLVENISRNISMVIDSASSVMRNHK